MSERLKIGALTLANNLVLAPMAGITNRAVRLLARDCGASLCFTEMVSSNGLVRSGRKSFELLHSCEDDRPLGVQLFGDDPQSLAESARLVDGQCELIDINMGCPVRKVVGTGAGSALLQEPGKVLEIVRMVRKATSLPLTIKIRSGWQSDDPSFLEIARIAEGEGCDAITLHPRSRSQMFSGKAAWTQIAELKRQVAIPVIGSGDLFSAADILDVIASTGCNGVMIARGSLGYPWIFRETLALMEGHEPSPPSTDERLSVILRHLDLAVELSGEKVAVQEMRKHISWYVRGLPGASRFRGTVNTITERDPLIRLLHDFFSSIP